MDTGGDKRKKNTTPQNMENIKIKTITWQEHYKLLVEFENGDTRIVDFEYRLRRYPSLHGFLDIEKFKNFKYDRHSVWWAGNRLDAHASQLYNWVFKKRS